ncbi:hypothetical protein ACPOL_1018 [Acidisarcina polymorpha]|uniref:DUF948 domain-containing protein n=1 Tax=Acidisarcina polymorpha TaxID=2211140 RepID=A0A2Z5FU34_9BACT|nr:hypothetical protein [Acidisarcina polymorpha]AXC10369.1 hypothetical protein ACPOL_1018 [Acidisarcina polymorpha]
MSPEIPPYVYLLFTAATAIGVLMQAGILLGLFLAFRKLQVKLEVILNHVTENALPMIASSKVTLEDLAPKIKAISNNLVVISETVKNESQTIKVSVDDVLEKTRAQTARVDEMVSGTLDGITHASAAIQHGISVPLRQLNGLLTGFKAGLDVLRSKSGDPRPAETSRYSDAASKYSGSKASPVAEVD